MGPARFGMDPEFSARNDTIFLGFKLFSETHLGLGSRQILDNLIFQVLRLEPHEKFNMDASILQVKWQQLCQLYIHLSFKTCLFDKIWGGQILIF